jgi:LPS-assembly protein
MSAKKSILVCLLAFICFFPFTPLSADTQITQTPDDSLAYDYLAKQLGWVINPDSECGGYYLEQPFSYPVSVTQNRSIEITSNHGLIAQRGTSTLEGSVTITRFGQQITANKVYLYRDPTSFKLMAAEMIENVNLREPNTLITGNHGSYNFSTNTKSLFDIFYRTSLVNSKEIIGPRVPSEEIQRERKITNLTAWGKADEISQSQPREYELKNASFSTCSPINPSWQVKGSHIELNKNTGRGYVTNARFLIKNVPVFYFPYINFSLDHQRKSGFLWPTIGLVSSSFGTSLLTPFYWNLAPNYDTTITPGFLSKRGAQLSDHFRYLTETSVGNFNLNVLPSDREFTKLKSQYQNTYGNVTDPSVEAELNRLLNSSTTRKSFSWHNDSFFNDHWSNHVDYNYAGDDYYLQDFGSNLNEITQNQLLQEGDIYYKEQHWNFTARAQTYQTLHPLIDGQLPVQNQYRRFPQLVLNSDYPNQSLGFEYFANSEFTHFDIRNTPGASVNLPIGNRMHIQPGMSLPLYWPYFYLEPRAQVALTAYQLYQINPTDTPGAIHRSVPIFDVASGLSFNRNMQLFDQSYVQTLEPQIYYTYIPYRNQVSIPIFDTTVNTLTYDQLFNYNRFSGIDRIGDANQIGVGITTRIIAKQSELEKVRLGIGDIIYFANRNVTLCNNNNCTDNATNHSNYQRLSPISGMLNYAVSPEWTFSANAIWNPVSKQLANSTLNFHYQLDPTRLINMAYSYVFNGDIQSGSITNTASNNLKLTDFSMAWPLNHEFSFVGRWSEDWNLSRLQNLLSGVQYDTCCWAIRLVGGRAFTQLQNETPQYQNEFYIQFALKGLGNIGSGDPTGLLSSINGYNAQFGQEI